MRVLVTGHAGYVGSVLAPMLAEAGIAVVGVDSGLFNGAAGSGTDVRDLGVADLAGVDAVIHLAGLCNDPLGALDPALTDAVNHRATLCLARLAKRAGVPRFLFASSCSVYGATGGAWVDEAAPLRPLTAYARSKAMAERGLAALADDAFSPVYLRCATAYGASPSMRYDLVLNNLAAWAHATGTVYLKSDGTAWRPLVHVEDIARAYLAVLEAPREAVHDRAFNVGVTDHNYRVGDLAEMVREAVPGSAVAYAPDARRDRRCYRVDCTRLARTLPGFAARRRPEDGAAELHRLLGARPVDVAEFEGPRHSRVARLKALMESGRLDASLRWHALPTA